MQEFREMTERLDILAPSECSHCFPSDVKQIEGVVK